MSQEKTGLLGKVVESVERGIARAGGAVENAAANMLMPTADNPVDEYVRKGGDVNIATGEPIPHGLKPPEQQQQVKGAGLGVTTAGVPAAVTAATTSPGATATSTAAAATVEPSSGAEARKHPVVGGVYASGYAPGPDEPGTSRDDVIVVETARLDPGTGKLVDREIHTEPAR